MQFGVFLKIKNARILHLTRLVLLACMTGNAHAQFTFGTESQTTSTANLITNGVTFQYTDVADSTRDEAYVPLTGNPATYITTTNGWIASLNVNISATSMTATASASPRDAMGLAIFHTSPSKYLVLLGLSQFNNAANYSSDYPGGLYGTLTKFFAQTNGNNDLTIPLGASTPLVGESIFSFSAAASSLNVAEAVGAVGGQLTLIYAADSNTVTGFYNGNPVGSYSLAGWGVNVPLTLVVVGTSGQGIAIPSGTVTATNFYAGIVPANPPQLTILKSGANVILAWPTNDPGYLLQSAANLNTSPGWSPVSAVVGVVNTNNTVTNATSSTQMFYRLYQ